MTWGCFDLISRDRLLTAWPMTSGLGAPRPAAFDPRRNRRCQRLCTSRSQPRRGCVASKRDRLSQRSGFREDPLMEVRAQCTTVGQHFDRATKQSRRSLCQRDHIEQCSAGLNVDKKINVAVDSFRKLLFRCGSSQPSRGGGFPPTVSSGTKRARCRAVHTSKQLTIQELFDLEAAGVELDWGLPLSPMTGEFWPDSVDVQSRLRTGCP